MLNINRLKNIQAVFYLKRSVQIDNDFARVEI